MLGVCAYSSVSAARVVGRFGPAWPTVAIRRWMSVPVQLRLSSSSENENGKCITSSVREADSCSWLPVSKGSR